MIQGVWYKNEVMEDKRFCKKCLLRDMDENEYFANLHDYMSRIDENLKAPAELYESRLEICKGCDYLTSGMCGACGCYVELRAFLTKNACPYKKW